MITENNFQTEGRIDTKVYDNSQLPDNWDSLSDEEKLEATQSVEPNEEYTDYNTTVDGMHTYFARELNPNDNITEGVTHLAVGNDDGTTPTSSDSSLNNEVFRKGVTSYTQNSNTLKASTFIDTNEANGESLKEIGLFAGPNLSDRMWNHSLIASVTKDSSRTITIEVTLTFTTA